MLVSIGSLVMALPDEALHVACGLPSCGFSLRSLVLPSGLYFRFSLFFLAL